MSIIFATGFDTTPSDADLRSQGWMANLPAAPTAGRAFSSPINNTGIPGSSLRLGGYSSLTTATGVALVGDPGFFNTGKTINQLWQAGGFVVGARMKFNSSDNSGLVSENDGWTGGMTTVASSSPRQVAVDGNNIYAIRKTTDAGTTWVLQKSTDGGITWTTLPSPPLPNALTTESTINVVEPGTLMVTRGSVAITGPSYTKNDGQSWTQITAMGSRTYGECIATGVPAYPYAFSVGGPTMSAGVGIWLSSDSIDGPWTQAAGAAVAGAAYPAGPLKFLPGLDSKLYCAFTGGRVASVDLSVGSGGTMPVLTNVPAIPIYTLDYLNGSILIGTSSGVYRADSMAGAWTFINAVPMYASVMDNGVLVFAGNDSSLYSTTDGKALSGAAYNGGPNMNGVAFHGLTKFGGKYVAWMNNGSLWECSYPSLLLSAGWQCVRWPDKGEMLARAQSGFGIIGAVAGSIVPSSGTFTVAASPAGASSAGLWIVAQPWAANARVIQLLQPGQAVVASGSVQCSRAADAVQLSNYHYYEILAIADPNVVNAFFYALRIDGGYYVTRSATSVAIAGPTDTTTQALINIPRTGNWTQFDDLYMTDYLGDRNRGAIGPLNIMRRTMNADVVNEWTKVGAAPTNAATVTKRGITTDLSNYLTSTTPGARESFTTTASASPDLSGYNVRAIQIEAYIKKINPADPDIVLAVGDVASAPILLAATGNPTFVSQTFPVDSEGKLWTVDAVPNLVVSIRNSGSEP